ncbi:MAG: hypothetical protein AB8G17_01675 [Gammaproteobacteria bacterium]
MTFGLSIRALCVLTLAVVVCVSQAQGITAPDTDGDGVNDARDNCLLAANADQRDSNDDGYGNACDMDLNNDGVVNVTDLGLFRSAFFTADVDADANGDGVVNAIDLGVLRAQFFAAPGPTLFVRFGVVDGSWDDPNNWRPARVPTESDHVLFDMDWASTTTFAPVSITSLQVAGASIVGQNIAGAMTVTSQFVVDAGGALFLRELPLSVGGSLDVLGEMNVEFSDLSTAGEDQDLRVALGGALQLVDSSVDLPSGISAEGTLTFDEVTGTLGPITGDGTVSLRDATLLLVGQHSPHYLGESVQLGNVFTLDGSIVGSILAPGLLTLAPGAWQFEPGSRLQDVDLSSQNFTLESPARLTVENASLGGTMTIAANAEISLNGSIEFEFFDLILASPVTVVQAAPVVTFSADNAALTGSGNFLLPVADVAGGQTTQIVFDGLGNDFSVDEGIDLFAERSVDLVSAPGTSLFWEGDWRIDGAFSVGAEQPQLTVSGLWQMGEGTINIQDAALLLTGDWFLFPGSFVGTGAQIEFAGEWSSIGGLTLVDSVIDLDVTSENSGAQLTLTNSVARVSGPYRPFLFSGISSDAQSVVEFSGNYFGSFLSLDMNTLPTGFSLGPGALMENVTVSGSVPLRARGGELRLPTLETDLLIENGATVTLVSPVLDEANIVLEAVDAVTTLEVIKESWAPALRGPGDIQFGGSSSADSLNTLVLPSEPPTFVPGDFVTVRTTTAGGRILSAESSIEFFVPVALALDAPGREVSVDASVDTLYFERPIALGAQSQLTVSNAEDIVFEGDLHLGVESILHSDTNRRLSFAWDFITPRVWSVELAGPDQFGKMILPNFADLNLDDVGFAPVLVSGYVPENCTTFVLTDGAFLTGDSVGIDASGLGGLSAALSDERNDVRLSVFDMPGCPDLGP